MHGVALCSISLPRHAESQLATAENKEEEGGREGDGESNGSVKMIGLYREPTN